MRTRVNQSKRGCLLVVVILCGFLSLLFLVIGPTQASYGVSEVLVYEVFAVLFGVVAFLAWRGLRGIRSQEQLGNQRKLYATRLAQWEKEGYDVSEFKDKWLA